MYRVFTLIPMTNSATAWAGDSRKTSSQSATGTYTLHEPTIGKKPMMNETTERTAASGTRKIRKSTSRTTDLIACVRNVEYTAPYITPRTFVSSASASSAYRGGIFERT